MNIEYCSKWKNFRELNEAIAAAEKTIARLKDTNEQLGRQLELLTDIKFNSK